MAKIRGVSDLTRNLKVITGVPTGARLDEIAATALEPLRDATNSGAPRPSLRSGAVIRKMKSSGQFVRTFWVAFRRGMPMRIAHLVEFGTAPHSLAKGASRRYGIMQDVPPFHPGTPPEPFFRPAYEATKAEVSQSFGAGVWNSITSVIRGAR